MEEIKPIIRVDVGESEQTVKGLKKEISELKDRILNLKKGSDDYNDAVEQLQADQRKLNEVMALTKKEAVAVEGSYDALTHQMSLLKKEWRATADEAKRADLGKQIDEINQQLKEMDASVGNFQRNVGNYVSHWEGMPEVTKDFGAAMREMNESIEPTKQKFEAVGKISSGLASGFAVVQGAAALLGVENENLEKTFVKLQAAMALMQGVKGLGDLVEGLGKAKVAFKNFGNEVSIVTKLLGSGSATGGAGVAAGGGAAAIGAIGAFAAMAAIAIVVAGNLDKLKQKIKGFSEADEAAIAASKLNTELTKLSSQSASGNITRVKQLADAYNDLGDDLDSKKQFVQTYAGELENMGIKMTDVNDAETIFKDETENYINALMARAKANAIAKKAEEDYAKFLEKKAELEEEVAEQEAKRNAGTPDKSFWQNLSEAIILGSNSELAAPIETNNKLVEDATREIANKNVEKAKQALNDAVAAADANLKKAFDEAKKLNEEADKYLKGGKKTTTTTTTSGGGKQTTTTTTPVEDVNVTLKKLIKERLQLEEGATKRKLELLDIEKQKAIETAYTTISDEKELKKELEKINMEFAGKEYDIEQTSLQKKLGILKEWKDANTDANIERLEIVGEIADTEVEIEQSKQDRLTEIAKQGYEDRKQTAPTSVETVTEQSAVGLKMIDDFKSQVNNFNEEWKSLNFTQKAAEIGNVVTTSLQGASQIFNQLADMYANEEELSVEEMKKIKNLRIAGATMDMLSGIVGAISSTAGMGPVGWVLGGIQSAIIATTGALNIANIKKQDVSGNSSGGGNGAATPSSSSYASDLPFSYTRQITGASEIDALNQDTRVYILESDIQESNKKVQVRESESSF